MGEEIYYPLIHDMTWSYSRISTFDQCPYKFFLKYISDSREVPMFYAEFGSFIHRILEGFYKGELTKDEMLMTFLTDFSSEVKGDRPSAEIVGKYIQKGSEYLRGFEPFPYKMLEVEKRIDFELNGRRFVGFIDYLGEDSDGGLIIVDNKSRDLKPRSNRKKPTLKDAELDEMLKQLYVYSYGIQEEFGRAPKKLCFNCFKAGVFIEEDFNEVARDDAFRWAFKTIEEIEEEEDFDPSLDYFYCNFLCEVHDDCVYHEEFQNSFKRGR